MSIYDNSAFEVEVAHILFVNMVGFTLRPLASPLQALNQFQRALQQAQAFLQTAEQQSVICLPTGDGAALGYFHSPVAPLRCALDIACSLAVSSVGMRLGLHSGLVCRVLDVNGRVNVSGEGINSESQIAATVHAMAGGRMNQVC